MTPISRLIVTENDECPICIEPFIQKEKAIITPCYHAFHKSCMERWSISQTKPARLNNQNAFPSCPSCRKSLTEKVQSVSVKRIINTTTSQDQSRANLERIANDQLANLMRTLIISRNFNRVNHLISKYNIRLNLDLVIEVLREDIEHNKKENIIKMLNITKNISYQDTQYIDKKLTDLLNSLPNDNKIQLTKIFLDCGFNIHKLRD